MQPNRGSSSGLAKANGQRSNTEQRERGRKHHRDAESAEKNHRWRGAIWECGGLPPLFATYSLPQSIKARRASPKKKPDEALALHMVLREPINIEENKRRQADQWQKPLADDY